MSELSERLWASDVASALTNEAARALEAQEARIAQLEKSAKLAEMYLRTGFIECDRCGHEVETKNTDAGFELLSTLTPTPDRKEAGE